MSYEIFDPRDDLITAFTVERDYNHDGIMEKVITFTGTDNKTHNVPVLSEEEFFGVDNPVLPAVYLTVVDGSAQVSTFGNSRYCSCLVDVHLYYTNNTWININTFHKTILGEIVDNITTKSKNCNLNNMLTAEVVGDVVNLRETDGNKIVYHKVLTIEAKNLETD